ncbi:MAG: hypothetical protein U0Z53_25295 [Blastocatellia bacterium]
MSRDHQPSIISGFMMKARNSVCERSQPESQTVYEQPLASRVSFVADWMSGNNGFGYATPGLAASVTRHSNFKAGYSIGNDLKKNNGLFLSYGVNF